jgi:hypothetical protein
MMSHRPTLTDGQREALPGILALLGLADAKLSPAEQASLCRLFHSIPYKDRFDDFSIRHHLYVSLQCVNAVGREETQTTIALNDPLQEAALGLRRAVDSLLGSTARRQS